MIERLKEYKGYKVPDHRDKFPCCGYTKSMEITGGRVCMEKGEISCEKCLLAGGPDRAQALFEYQRFYDPTKNDTPVFAMPEFWLNRLKSFWNGKESAQSNIQIRDALGTAWLNTTPAWFSPLTYRLDPAWKPDENYTLGEISPAEAAIQIIITDVQTKLDKIINDLRKEKK